MPQSDAIIDFDQLCDVFTEIKVYTSPSELHGALCGQLCAGMTLDHTQWLSSAIEYLDAEETATDELKASLITLLEQSEQELKGIDFEMQLLLPDDDAELAERTATLGEWCMGFLAGFGLAGTKSRDQLSAEVQECLEDFAAISHVSDNLEETEPNEVDFVEVSEYVRMAALMVYAECGKPQDNGVDPAPELH